MTTSAEQAGITMRETEQTISEAVNAIEQKLGVSGLSEPQADAIREDVARIRDAGARLGAARQGLDEGQAASPEGTAAATTTLPTAPEEAGEGTVHEDGSVAPVQGEAPEIGTTRVVQ